MVCNKCSKLSSGTKLATPGVKKKSDMYYGSPASSSTGEKKSATLGQTGISKSKLLSKSAKNPYAQYSRYVFEVYDALISTSGAWRADSRPCSSCEKCKTKVSQGHKYCHKVCLSWFYGSNRVADLDIVRLSRQPLRNVWQVERQV